MSTISKICSVSVHRYARDETPGKTEEELDRVSEYHLIYEYLMSCTSVNIFNFISSLICYTCKHEVCVLVSWSRCCFCTTKVR